MVSADEVLGSGENRAFIYDRQGQTRLLELPSASIEYGRLLSDVSAATVNVAPSLCDPRMGLIHTWAHSVVIYRNGSRVWEGPIRKIEDDSTGLTLTASDVLGWAGRRLVKTARSSSGYIRSEMQYLMLLLALADDPNIAAFVTTVGTAKLSSEIEESVGATLADVLASCVAAGGMYTTVGRRILLWDEAATVGRTPTLTPELHLTSGVTIVEDGDNLVTGAMAIDDDGAHAYMPTAGSVDSFYGLVESVVSVGTGTHTTATLQRYASKARNQGYPAPVTIEFPADAALQCDAPFPMHMLVPGVVVPVETTTATARKVSGTFTLTGVSVKQGAGGEEKVSLTLTPISAAAAS